MSNLTKILVLITIFFMIAGLETWRPLFQGRKNRWLHGGKNIFSMALTVYT